MIADALIQVSGTRMTKAGWPLMSEMPLRVAELRFIRFIENTQRLPDGGAQIAGSKSH
jgi:hypothetical protein